MSRKAVFFDIDGTLWDEHFVIPESTKEAIRKLRENGHLAYLCSGRTRAFIQDERLLALGFDGIVAGCGTWIEMDGKTLFYKKLEQELIEDTIHILKEYGIPTVYEGSRNLYMDLEEFEEDPYGLKLKETLGEDLLPVTGNEGIMEISKFSCSTPDDAYLKVISHLEENFTPLVHDAACAEFVPKGFSKASGIEKTCELLGIEKEDTYAFGDSINDVEMLKHVQHGIAMGNGTKAAKEAADYITAPLHEDGIYKGLEHFGLIS